MKKRNPKQVGSMLFDCVPQRGPCPNNCNQCYYNECFYAGHEPLIPEPRDVAGGIVRMNSGHDSNLEKPLVLETAKLYEDVFFNTSIPNYDFPGPVILTANPNEESYAQRPPIKIPPNVMFVRLRTSTSNLDSALKVATEWTGRNVPIVLTFMRYRTRKCVPGGYRDLYENKLYIEHEWWVSTKKFWVLVLSNSVFQNNRLIQTCGSYESSMCCDCGLCECYYRITKKRLEENGYYK